MDILWRVFDVLTEPVQCTFLSVNRRNNEARAGFVIRIQTYIYIRNPPIPLKYEKLATKYLWIYTDIFTVYRWPTRGGGRDRQFER